MMPNNTNNPNDNKHALEQQQQEEEDDEQLQEDTNDWKNAAPWLSPSSSLRQRPEGLSHRRRRQRRRRHHNNNTATTTTRRTTVESSSSSRFQFIATEALLHLFILAVYIFPMMMLEQNSPGSSSTSSSSGSSTTAVLDEVHLVGNNNHPQHGDIYNETVSWHDIWTHDYWGRPMNSPSSHKSWRPLTVLTFRYWKNNNNNNPLLGGSRENNNNNNNVLVQRLFNVLTHAALAEGVGILAMHLAYHCIGTTRPTTPTTTTTTTTKLLTWQRRLTKVLFALHPTHVEVSANAANRPHVLAALIAVWLCSAPLAAYPVLLLAGFLSSETFLFAVVPVAVTRTVLLLLPFVQQQHRQQHRQQRQQQQYTTMSTNNTNTQGNASSSSVLPWGQVLAAWLLLGTSAVAYYGLRYHLDWLSIPVGLIRPAENPFFALSTGGDNDNNDVWRRIQSYAYVTVVHIAKAWDLDFVGFSHEYGHACILPIDDWKDPRFALTGAILSAYLVITLVWTWHAWSYYWRITAKINPTYSSFSSGRQPLPMGWILWMVHLSWMVTLFPITGIVKVGTFVADRIVVQASVGTSMLVAYWLSTWLMHNRHHRKRFVNLWNPSHWTFREVLVVLLLAFSWRRIHKRTTEWLGPVPLLESSLRTCPRSAKSHLEYSKTLSGMFPDRTDLKKARWHLEQVEDIDPNYCDVHQQFAHLALQEGRFVEFEERLTKAVTCPFTMGGSMETWKRYWKMTLDPTTNSPQAIAAATARQKEYLRVIDAAIAAEQAAATATTTTQKSASPLVWKRGK